MFTTFYRRGLIPVSILYKSIAGRYRPVRVADGPITARYRFIKNANLYKSIAGRYRHVRVADGPIMARCRFIKNATCSWDMQGCKQKVKKVIPLYKMAENF